MESQGRLNTSPCFSKQFNWLRLQDKCQFLEWNPHFEKIKAFHTHYIIWSIAIVYAYTYIKMISESLELNLNMDLSDPYFFRDSNTVNFTNKKINICINVKCFWACKMDLSKYDCLSNNLDLHQTASYFLDLCIAQMIRNSNFLFS